MKREPQFYKEESAVKYGFINFESALKSTLMKDRVIDEAMKRYAEDMCKSQKQICADALDIGYEDDLHKQQILNARLATDK